MGDGTTYATMADVARFRLLASAIAGVPMDVALAAPGDPAWTDGRTLFVCGADAPADQVRSVAVQAALIAAGSFEPEILRELTRRARAIRRYLCVEGHRALSAQEALLPLSARALVDHMTAGASTSPADSLRLALGRDEIGQPPPCFGVLRPKQFRPPASASAPGGSEDALTPTVRTDQLTELADDAGDDESSAVDVSSPVGGGGVIGKLLQRMLGNGRSDGTGAAGADRPTHWARQAARAPGHFAATTAAACVTDEGETARGSGVTYPEWDQGRGRYRPDWCTVTEVEPADGEASAFQAARTHALRRVLARVALDVERRRRQPQGNDIDIDATVDAVVELRAGSSPGEAIYIDDVRRRRDLSVLVLLDVSGSAGEPGAAGVAVHDHQRDAAALLTATFHELGDRVALYAFRSMGRSAVHVTPVKRFDDAFGSTVLRRLGGLVPGAYTRLGAAIRHGATVLEAEGGTARRLLIVLSDGFAYDHGYEGPYGEADARRALSESRRRGTGCLCLSVGALNDVDALRRVFGTAALARVSRVEDVSAAAGPLVRVALRSAEAQRRTRHRSAPAHPRTHQQRSHA